MKITINDIVIEGTPQELQSTLDMLLERAASHGEAVVQGPDGSTLVEVSQQSVPLTASEFRNLWPELRLGSRKVLAEVAKHPDGYPVADLLAVLGVEGQKLGGMLSSLGFAIKRTQGKRDPLVRDWVLGQYRLAPDIAATVRELAQQ